MAMDGGYTVLWLQPSANLLHPSSRLNTAQLTDLSVFPRQRDWPNFWPVMETVDLILHIQGQFFTKNY